MNRPRIHSLNMRSDTFSNAISKNSAELIEKDDAVDASAFESRLAVSRSFFFSRWIVVVLFAVGFFLDFFYLLCTGLIVRPFI